MRIEGKGRVIISETSPQATRNSSPPVFQLSTKSTKGKVYLTLKGFSQQQQIDVNDIARELNKLPVEHLERLDEIRFYPHANKVMKAAYRATKKGFWSGLLMNSTHRIEIYKVESKRVFLWALMHELGHFVMDMKMGSRDRKRWVTQLHQRTGAVSEYALTNAGEDFAESYACYVINPQRLNQCDIARYRFLKYRIFEGREIVENKAKKPKRKLDLMI